MASPAQSATRNFEGELAARDEGYSLRPLLARAKCFGERSGPFMDRAYEVVGEALDNKAEGFRFDPRGRDEVPIAAEDDVLRVVERRGARLWCLGNYASRSFAQMPHHTLGRLFTDAVTVQDGHRLRTSMGRPSSDRNRSRKGRCR